MKLKYIYFILIPLLTGVLILSAFNSSTVKADEEKGNENIIKFSHSFHKDLAECKDCHSAVTNSTSLKDRLMPNHDNCKDCHDVEDTEQCTTCHYEDNFEPLKQNESDLYFDHSYHINTVKTACETCHKGISEADYGNQAHQPNPIMEDCYSCHNDHSAAQNFCESCHVSTADLIPQSHRSTSFIKTHEFASKEFDANCIMCHDANNNSCIECHAANNIITDINLPDNFYQPYAPNNFVDDARMQKINRVHELNYRFTHGLDAKGKTFECQSCHQVETFCANCHQSQNSDFAMSGILPASHLKPDFFTIGVGTGGGEHAILAKRDMESCVACHDVQGADPTCITCHLDTDGIKGTNPKTHARDFMRDVEGDWHESAGSVCYNCHTNASPNSQAGMGFCGYCHGIQN